MLINYSANSQHTPYNWNFDLLYPNFLYGGADFDSCNKYPFKTYLKKYNSVPEGTVRPLGKYDSSLH